MRARSRQSEALAELGALLKHHPDPEEVRELLANSGEDLAPALGVGSEALAALSDRELIATLTERLRQLVATERAERGRDRQSVAIAAAGMLTRLARWAENEVFIDAPIVLGTLLSDSTVRVVSFEPERLECIAVRAQKLRQASRVLRRFEDLTASLASDGLRLRWRGGRGGLTLWPQPIEPKDRDAVLHVPLERPRPRRVARPERAGAWLADVLTEMGVVA